MTNSPARTGRTAWLLLRLYSIRTLNQLAAIYQRFRPKKAASQRTATPGKFKLGWLAGGLLMILMGFSFVNLARHSVDTMMQRLGSEITTISTSNTSRHAQEIYKPLPPMPGFALPNGVMQGAALQTAILMIAITLGVLGNSSLSQDDWELEWLTTLPVPLSTILGIRIAIRALLNPYGLYGLWPFLSVVAWFCGYRVGAPLLGFAVSFLLLLTVATIQTVVDTGLRLRMSPPKLRNLQAIFAVLSLPCLFLAFSSSHPGSFVLQWAPSWPAWSSWLPPGLAVQAVASNDLSSIFPAVAVLLIETAGIVAAGMLLLRRLLHQGVVMTGARESGRREHVRPVPVSRAGEGQRWLLTPIQARELRLLARDRNFLVQTLLLPALILGAQFFFNTNGTALLGSLLHHPEQVAAAAFALSAYALMFSAFQTLNAEGQALWILYSVPQSLASVLRQKGYFWAVASLVYPVIIFGLAMMWGGMAFSQSLGLVIVVFLGAPIYATIAVSLGVFACDPLARTVDRRVSQSYVYLYLILSSIYVLAIYASTIWQRGVLMFLTTLFAFALWQRARDHLPYLLDPDASPPSQVSVSDGIMAALLLFALQTIVTLILRFNGVPQTGEIVMLTVAGVGAIAFGVIRLAFWLLKSQNMPKTFGPGGARAATLGLAGGVAAALAAFVYLKLAVQAGLFERPALLPANKSMLLIGALVVLVVPIVEEFIFRGLIFRGFRRSLGLTASVISSAALFAIVHPPASVIPVFGLGIVTALVYERTQLLIGTMVAHAVYNALIISLPLILTL